MIVKYYYVTDDFKFHGTYQADIKDVANFFKYRPLSLLELVIEKKDFIYRWREDYNEWTKFPNKKNSAEAHKV